MIVEFMDSGAGTAGYVNPAYVEIVRPDPADPTRVTLIKLRGGDEVHVHGDPQEVADKLAHGPVGV